ncbi:UNVERIFIED_CONTAM: hypothetical protein FKN15_050383 [Acipenser sinensis]
MLVCCHLQEEEEEEERPTQRKKRSSHPWNKGKKPVPMPAPETLQQQPEEEFPGCYACAEPGHSWMDCPLYPRSQPSRLYPICRDRHYVANCHILQEEEEEKGRVGEAPQSPAPRRGEHECPVLRRGEHEHPVPVRGSTSVKHPEGGSTSVQSPRESQYPETEGDCLLFPPPQAEEDYLLFQPPPAEEDGLLFPLPPQVRNYLQLPPSREGDYLQLPPPPQEGYCLNIPPPPQEEGPGRMLAFLRSHCKGC